MPGTFFSIVIEIVDPSVSSIIRIDQNLALGVERPDVGSVVIFLLAHPQ